MRNWTDRINRINRSYRIVQSFQGFRTDPNYPDRPELTCSLYTSWRHLHYPIRLT